jgi:signal transduction histidine kinase
VPDTAASRQDAWLRSPRRWDLYSAIILLATLATNQLGGQSPRQHAITAAALLAMAAWYVAVGRSTLFVPNVRRATIYLAGLVPLLAASQSFGVTSTVILLALCPQCFLAVPFRRAVVAMVALSCTPLAAQLVVGASGRQLAAQTGNAVLVIAFSLAFGTWVAQIINQSAERGNLIDELEATRAQLAAAHREAGAAAERQRMSADIHDTIAQGFTSIVMLIQAAETGIGSDPDGARRHLDLAAATARDNLAEARALVAGLTSAQLDGSTLGDALRRIAGQTASQAGITADVEITGTARPLGTATEVMLLRVGQEALANVRRHARASRATVRLDYAAEQVRLRISDDGDGFDPDGVNDGYGLRGMRSRVAEAGASLTVRSEPGDGTEVRVEVRA